MSTELKIFREERIIQRTVTGELNTNRAHELIHKISLAVSFYQNSNVLIDIRETTFQPNMSDLLEIAADCSKNLTDFKCKIAFVIPNTEQRKEVAKLFKACMEAQGFEFRQFFDYDDAMDWLS